MMQTKELFVGVQADSLYIIDRAPRPGTDDPFHERPDVNVVASMENNDENAQELAKLFAAAPALAAENERLKRAVQGLLPYLEWTVGPESPGYHPTLPSAVRALRSALADQPPLDVGGTYRHRKTGGLYRVIYEAEIESDAVPAVVYRHIETGRTWVRPRDEFLDGRFEHVATEMANEPVFVLRGQDIHAPRAVREWICRTVISLGDDHPKITQARAIAAAMEAWPVRKHPD